MKIYTETPLSRFEFWSGAKDTANRIWEEMGESGFDTVEAILEDTYPEGIDETTLNDIFWFEPETIYEWLGMSNDDDEEEEEEEEDYIEGETEHDAQIFERFCTPGKDCKKCPYDKICKTQNECHDRFYQILADYDNQNSEEDN